MRSSLAVSVAIHVLITLVLWIGVHLNANLEARPVIYRVNLVEPVIAAPVPAEVEEAPVEPEVKPEPVPESPVIDVEPEPMPTELPDLQVRRRRTRDAELAPPEAAEPKPISLDKPDRRRREIEKPKPEPAAPQPAVSEVVPAPEEAAPAETPRGKSTQATTDSPAFAEFAYYRVAMQNKLSALWSPPRASSEIVCSVRFRIVRSGAIVGARVETSSGLAIFDHTALRATIEASPLPPLPADFPGDVVGVTMQFAYKP
jgi:protein TonB